MSPRVAANKLLIKYGQNSEFGNSVEIQSVCLRQHCGWKPVQSQFSFEYTVLT